MAAGILSLEPGEEDTQEPHESDEIYYIIKGNGSLHINKNDYSVKPGKAFFVPKNIASAHINLADDTSRILALADISWKPDDNEMVNTTFEDYDWNKWKK